MGISITGLSSGLDTASIVESLMQIERQPYNRLSTQKTNLQSEQAVFRAINTKLNTLSNAVSDLMLNSSFNILSASSSDESVVKLTAGEAATTGTFNVNVTQVAQSHSIKSGIIDANGTTLLGKTLTIDRDGTANDITIDTSGLAAGTKDRDVLEYIKNQINSKNTGLTASIVSVSDTQKVLVLTSKETGENNKMVLGSAAAGTGQIGLGGTALDASALNITDVSDNGANTTQKAQDAILSVNGITVTRSTNKITDVISGTTIEVQKAGSSTIKIATDADKVAGKIQAFVNAYNDVITTVRNNLAKPADSGKMNPLQGDSLLKDIDNKLYNIFNSLTASSPGFQSMAQIGLEIDKGVTKASLMTFTITFDKEQFKQKFTEDPQAVINLFKMDDTSPDNRDGIMRIMNQQIKEWTNSVDGTLTSKIKGYDAEISTIDDRMTALNDRLIMKEEQLKKQFSAMEVALSQLKSQQSWLSSQLASLTATTKASS